jgi:hypothetical protein
MVADRLRMGCRINASRVVSDYERRADYIKLLFCVRLA